MRKMERPAEMASRQAVECVRLAVNGSTNKPTPFDKQDVGFADINRLTGSQLGIFDRPCPACGPGRREPRNRTRPVLRIWRTRPEFATFKCQRCGIEGWVKADRTPTLANPTHGSLLPSKPKSEDDEPQRIRRALTIWHEAIEPKGTVVALYLASRGLRILGQALRCHPALIHSGAIVAGMVAPLTDIVTGEPCGVHRTFLDGQGRKIDRRMLGRAKGGCIRLTADEEVTTGVGIAEGIETALAVTGAGWRPVWALGSAGGIERFPVLAGVEALTLFADNDAAGIAAARACARRWAEAGREAKILRPQAAGADWNEVLAG